MARRIKSSSENKADFFCIYFVCYRLDKTFFHIAFKHKVEAKKKWKACRNATLSDHILCNKLLHGKSIQLQSADNTLNIQQTTQRKINGKDKLFDKGNV